jgi:hypothetical protein
MSQDGANRNQIGVLGDFPVPSELELEYVLDRIAADWELLPPRDRQTECDVSLFTLCILNKYDFEFEGDRYHFVKEFLCRHLRTSADELSALGV